MIQDPYKVLGISRDATPEEIKKAYRKKAKEYHPDLHPDDPVAAEKMNEVNEAYDMLSNPEKYKKREQDEERRQQAYRQASQNGYGGYSGYGNPGGYTWYGNFDDMFGFGRQAAKIPKPHAQTTDSMMVRQVVQLINEEQYEQANQMLNQIISSYRDGRWFYLSALAHYGMGNQMLAAEQIQKAIRMEPQNQGYQQIYQMMRQAGRTYSDEGKEFTQYAYGMDKMCTTFCLAQLFCTFCRCC